MQKYLIDILQDLAFVEQNPIYHPEGDALFHSLQVFQLSLKYSSEPDIWAAALFHDVGKAIDGPTHAQIGADMLNGVLNTHIQWLICHHLDLLIHPKKTQRKLRNTHELKQLTLLRDIDLRGRDPYAEVCTPRYAVEYLLPFMPQIRA